MYLLYDRKTIQQNQASEHSTPARSSFCQTSHFTEMSH